MIRLRFLILAVVLAFACTVTANANTAARAQTTPDTGVVAAAKATSPATGFDTCAAPSATTMSAWWTSSPYTSAAVYIGGALRGCPSQPNLTPAWVSTVTTQGWRLVPVWVGPQAPCGGFSQSISLDPATAAAQGRAEADGALAALGALGLRFSPVYYDLEAYPRGGACSAAVQAFMTGWTMELAANGTPSGLYSSLCSGILDEAAVYGVPGFAVPDAVWIAAWNGTPNIFGFTGSCALADSLWPNHQRLHQYLGAHDETWGGVTINVDTNAVDGPTGPRAVAPPDAPVLTGRAGAGVVHLGWEPPATSGAPVSGYQILRGSAPGNEVVLTEVAAAATSFDDLSAPAATTYYRVVAHSLAGDSPGSNEVAIPVGPAPTVSVLGRDAAGSLWSGALAGPGAGTWTSLGPTIVGNPAVLVDRIGTWAFARGSDKALWYRRSTDGTSWAPWTSLGPTIAGDPTAAYDGTGVAVFATGPDGALWSRRYTYATDSWSGWSTLGATVVGRPVAVSGAAGMLVFARGADDALWFQRWTDGSTQGSGLGSWSGWLPLGPTIASDPTAVADAAGAWVFARGPDGSLWYRRSVDDGATWSGWSSLEPAITGTPSAAVDGGGVWVFARGADAGLWYRRWTGSWTPWLPLGPTIAGSPSARATNSGVWVVARGSDAAFWYRQYQNGWSGWVRAGGTLASDPATALGP